jgi:hypothetical protein
VFRPEAEERYRRAAAELALPPLIQRRARRWQWLALVAALFLLVLVARVSVPVAGFAPGVIGGAVFVEGSERRLVYAVVPSASAAGLQPGSPIELEREDGGRAGRAAVLRVEREADSAAWRSAALLLRAAGADVERGRDVIVAGAVAVGEHGVREGDRVRLSLPGRTETLGSLMLRGSSAR